MLFVSEEERAWTPHSPDLVAAMSKDQIKADFGHCRSHKFDLIRLDHILAFFHFDSHLLILIPFILSGYLT